MEIRYMVTVCIPTLHYGTGIITEQVDMVAYLIRHVFSQSAKTSILYEDEKVSFRALDAQYGRDKNELAEMLTRKFSTLISRYIPDGNVSIAVTATEPDENGLYNLEVRATTNDSVNGQLILTDAMISIKDSTTLNIVFKGAKI